MKNKIDQLELLDLGNKIPDDQFFSPQALKQAIREVSKAKFERTLLAEYPNLIDNLKKFKGASPRVTADWMSSILRDRSGQKIDDIDLFANELMDIGFLKRVGEAEWWVPYIYQYALGIATDD